MNGADGGRQVQVDVDILSAEPGIPDTADLCAWVRFACGYLEADARLLEVAVRVVDEDESRALNRDWRGQDAPTNVLSFPAGPIAGLPADETLVLGDIVVCAPVVRREADKQGKPVAHHWAHMLVHGTLHLAGYDHVTTAQAERMEALEKRILAGLEIPDPYGAA